MGHQDRRTPVCIVVNLGHDCVEEQPSIVLPQKRRCFTLNKGIEPTLIKYIVIRLRVLVESCVLFTISCHR